MNLATEIDGLRDEVIAFRHDLHAHPEPGFEEFRSSAKIREALESVGLEVRSCAGTGLIADLGAGDGPCIALRADMDCLRMTEENHGLPYRSQNEGFAHMCGHDGHSAVLMGTAKLLAGVAKSIPGRVRLLFQPAEEGPGGAPKMIEEGALEGVDEVYGMHNWPTIPLHELRTIAGPCMATVATLKVVVKGKGGHASQPQEARDPILAGAHMVTALQSIVSRNVHYLDRAVLSITMFHGGEVHNVIPDQVEIQGTIRALSQEVFELIRDRIQGIVAGTAASLGVSAEVSIEPMYPVVLNTAQETALVERVGRREFGEESVSSEGLPMLGAEDFSYFLQQRPGCFFFLGGAEAGRTNSSCHATDYDFNDKLVELGMRFWVALLEERFGRRFFDPVR